MSELLLEIYGEEIPSSSQALIEDQLKELFNELLEESKVKFSSMQTFSTSRRVILIVKDLPTNIESKVIEIRGPQIEANQSAIDGFMKSNNINDIRELKKKKINGKVYYTANKKTEEKKLSKIFEDKIPELLRSIKWIKSMRWADNNDKWIRPIKNILCLFKMKVVKFNFAGISSNQFTYGNYHFTLKKIKCTDFKSYKKNLEKNFVILEQKKREKIILLNIEKFCKKNNLIFNVDLSLLKRVANSVEYPNVHFSSFEADFFKLPNFLLEDIMTNKQDYFSFKNKNKKLSNFFCFISGIDSKNKLNLIRGNQNVLKARFSDASFFIDEDLKKNLHDRLSSLKNIVFYERSGNLYERAQRIEGLVKYILELSGKRSKNFYRHIILSNADLSTELVKEFPNLQGRAGGFYAEKEKFPKDIHIAFSDQYDYEFNKSYDNYLTYVLSISQKFDAVIGYFISRKKITGAGDPFGVRRSILSIIKICMDKNININFYELFLFLKNLYINQQIDVEISYNDLQEFFKKRIFVLLSSYGFRNDVIRTSLHNKKINPLFVLNRAKQLSTLLDSRTGKDFLKAFKRLNSLISEDFKDELNIKLFKENQEYNLKDLIDELTILSKKNQDDFLFNNIKFLKKMTVGLNNFFDNVIVNVENFELKKNRKILIYKFHKTLEDKYNFSNLEI